ncbi:MAG: cation-translocating P-type ATPase [Myxococcales bacterium]|nr:cation-translocating P-type ATPase [Myxococcales bacterium]
MRRCARPTSCLRVWLHHASVAVDDAPTRATPAATVEGADVSDPPSGSRDARGPAVADVLQLEDLVGLSEADARARLEQDGPNELPAQQHRNLLAIVLEVVREPMFLMLVAAGVVYLLLGEPADALMLLGFVFVVMTITIVQARRTEHALEALRDLSSPRALVIRDGHRRRIAGREVVAGDLVVLTEGDRVPADGLLRQTLHLAADESLLTGESVPVRKVAAAEARALERPGGDDLPSVFSGTLVTSGQGIVEIAATGPRTELGKIGKALAQTTEEPTMLQTETRRIVRMLAIAGLGACGVVVVAFALTRGGGAGAWEQGFLAGIAMAMAILPEEFPVVLTIFLALGAWRLSRSRVLTRRMPAIEMLGAATVLCVDKTGTLTQNQMTLRTLAIGGEATDLAGLAAELPEELHGLLEHAILASKRDPFDPMERALHEAGDQLIKDTEHLHPSWSLAREYPLTPGLLAVSHAWSSGDGDDVVVSTKGAPEAIADLCHLGPAQRDALAGQVLSLAAQGLRVLGVARGATRVDRLPDQHHDLALELVGLLGFEDPLRPAVPGAVAECLTAGVRVVMITGDYPATAQSIARHAGLTACETVLTGADLDGMADDELARRVAHVQIFARVVPEQKLRIVNALKANDEVVAMTGDGVNDAAALKAAHIGIAMGGRGTDVAREAASLVLLDDDFSSIVAAVKLGRRIYDNIKKAIVFIVAVHVPIAGLSMLPVFFADWPLLILPVHIAFLQLIIDPACTLIFEAEQAEADVMRRPPRERDVGLFSRETLGIALLQGFSVLAVCLGAFLLARRDHADDAARALTFVTLVVALVVVILVNRSWVRSAVAMFRVPNPAVRWVLLGAISFLGVAILVPVARRFFHFAPLHLTDLLLSLGAGLVCVLWFEVVKQVRRARAGHGVAPA